MDKKRYYVSVQAGTIMEKQGDSAYEFEIDASEADVQLLREWFEQRASYEFDSFEQVLVVAIPYHLDTANDQYDECMRAIYSKIYQLGTEETKKHIQ